ncbi:LPXTG cell wall anchor domain-containing protein [Bacillus sp. FJAT-47783]|uniref:LPXTG cell wall anchor domain-containing protein n=1 Tax=Bacillus sp. FJAT-47783 TaxID=2922712 RepID=UPI001FAE31AE|nr:LPXTG cell wall anchor domain-containing protein [Bacillus sp. FJAT-47783]
MVKYLKLYVLVTLAFMLFATLPTRTAFGDEQNEVDLSLAPGSFSIFASNLKPGDSVTRKIVLSNTGLRDIKYITSVQFEDGSKKFFQQLLVEVYTDREKLFSGKLMNLHEFAARPLAIGEDEQLWIKVIVPSSLGNEYQGLRSVVKMIFYAEDDLVTEVLSNGGENNRLLPMTATHTMNVLIIGMLLTIAGIVFVRFKKRDSEKIQL